MDRPFTVRPCKERIACVAPRGTESRAGKRQPRERKSTAHSTQHTQQLDIRSEIRIRRTLSTEVLLPYRTAVTQNAATHNLPSLLHILLAYLLLFRREPLQSSCVTVLFAKTAHQFRDLVEF